MYFNLSRIFISSEIADQYVIAFVNHMDRQFLQRGKLILNDQTPFNFNRITKSRSVTFQNKQQNQQTILHKYVRMDSQQEHKSVSFDYVHT